MNTFSNSLTFPQRPTSEQARRAALRAALARAGNAVWEALGLAKNPAQPLRPASTKRNPALEAAAVRDMACALMQTDPRFAAELCAAADRHESQYAH